jgi:hypothetical protein
MRFLNFFDPIALFVVDVTILPPVTLYRIEWIFGQYLLLFLTSLNETKEKSHVYKVQFFCPQKVEKNTHKSCSEKLKSPFFLILPEMPKLPKQKNSCSKMWLKDQLYIELGTKWQQDNNIHNKKNSKLLAYEAACSCFQPKNAWKFDQQNDFTVFFHLKSYYNLRLQFLLFFLWS